MTAQGPRNGNEARRSRNTVVNNASKYRHGYRAPVSSAGAIGYGDQLAAARWSYLSQLAALKAEKGAIRGDYRLGVAQARSDAVSGMAGAVNNALDRGLFNSSIDLGARSGVIGQRAADIAAAKSAKAQGLLGLQRERMGLQGQYYQSVAGIQNQISQEELAQTIAAFQNDSFDANNFNYRDILAAIKARKGGYSPGSRRGV